MKKIDCTLSKDITDCLDVDLLRKAKTTSGNAKDDTYKKDLKYLLGEIQKNIMIDANAGDSFSTTPDINIKFKEDIEKAFVGLGFNVEFKNNRANSNFIAVIVSWK